MKKYLRLLYIIPLSFLVTLLYWGCRYVWFGIEIVSAHRIGICLSLFLLTSIIIPPVEFYLESNQND